MDINKLTERFDSLLDAISADEFKEWIDFDNSQLVLEKLFNGERISATSSFVSPASIKICGLKTYNDTSLEGEINYNLAA